MSVLRGPIRQIGYVVTDLDHALASWLELGVGPWFVVRDLPMRALYRGEACATTLSLAMTTLQAFSPNSSMPTGRAYINWLTGQRISIRL
jgi:hypothetical protein